MYEEYELKSERASPNGDSFVATNPPSLSPLAHHRELRISTLAALSQQHLVIRKCQQLMSGRLIFILASQPAVRLCASQPPEPWPGGARPTARPRTPPGAPHPLGELRGGLAEVASGWGRSGRGAGPQSAPHEPKIAVGPGESQLQMAILEDY